MYKIISLESVPLCISIPDEACVERSCVGSIHLLPNRPKDITGPEWSYINTHFSQFKIIALPIPLSKPVKRVPMKSVSESEPEQNLVEKMLGESVQTILKELEDKKALMEADEYQELLEQLIDGEESGAHNRESPRATLLRKLRTELEE